jgi:HEAT repeat protein
MPPSTKPMGRRRARLAAIGLISVALLVGCHPFSDLERHLNAGAFDRAVQEATGKRKTELALAVLILERRLRDGGQIALIDTLSRAGKLGRRSLKRLAQAADPKLARLARIALRRNRDPSIDEIMLVLNDPDSDVRHACIRAWHRQMTLLVLERAILDLDPRVRRFAVKGVSAVGMERDVSDLLKEALRLDPSTKVRAEAAMQGKLLGADAHLALVRALDDKELGVKLAAIRGLAETGAPESLALLEAMAVGPVDYTQVAAAAELARLDRPVGRKRLMAALEDERAEIRKAALLRTERAGLDDRRAILLDHLKDESKEVVLLAARLLLQDQAARKRVHTALSPIFQGEGASRDEARDMLAVIGDEKALKTVREILSGDNPKEVIATVEHTQGAPGLHHQFLALMADKDKEVRAAAAKAIIFSWSKI